MTNLPADYGSLVRELHKRAAKKRQPASGTFELTRRCNLACQMCYVRSDEDHPVQRAHELSSEAWVALANDAVANGLVFLLLTGGEVFLRPDFFEIYEPLTRLGLILVIFTNGTLIDDAVAERLADAPPSCVEITLYGASAETYEAITRIPGSYARCCAGVEALLRYDVPLGLKTTITQRNVAEWDAMRKMAHDWDLPFSGSWLLSRRPDGAMSDVDEYRLPARECVRLEATDRIAASDWIEVALRESTGRKEENFYCHAGKASFAVSPGGEMNTCLQLPHPATRPLDIGFADAWKKVQAFVDNVPSLSPNCSTCDALAYCSRCPAWSLMETGTLTDPVPYLCEIAWARKSEYQVDV